MHLRTRWEGRGQVAAKFSAQRGEGPHAGEQDLKEPSTGLGAPGECARVKRGGGYKGNFLGFLSF